MLNLKALGNLLKLPTIHMKDAKTVESEEGTESSLHLIKIKKLAHMSSDFFSMKKPREKSLYSKFMRSDESGAQHQLNENTIKIGDVDIMSAANRSASRENENKVSRSVIDDFHRNLAESRSCSIEQPPPLRYANGELLEKITFPSYSEFMSQTVPLQK
jgi:hypothetical protein